MGAGALVGVMLRVLFWRISRICSKSFNHAPFFSGTYFSLFIGELLKISWASKKCDLEFAKPEVDNAGYDLILEANGIIRHVQLKSGVY